LHKQNKIFSKGIKICKNAYNEIIIKVTKNLGKEVKLMSKSSTILIVYFSFDDGANLEVERLRRKTKADIIKLEPENPYPSDYVERLTMIEREFQRGDLPRIKTCLPNLNDYHEIYLGYPPIFGNRLPSIIHSFFASFDLKGKTVIPFSEIVEEPLRATLCEMNELAQKYKVKLVNREA